MTTVTRRRFMKVSVAGLAASSVGALGFGGAGEALAAGIRLWSVTAFFHTLGPCVTNSH